MTSYRLQIAVQCAALATVVGAAGAQTVVDARFAAEIVYSSGNGMTAFDFDASGNIYVAEKQGRVLRLTPTANGYALGGVFADLRSQVDSALESGLLGLTLDPGFASNRHIYALYTTRTEQRLVRLVANASGTSMVREEVVLAGLPREFDIHNGGHVQFHPNDPDHVYLSLGDDSHPERAQGPTSYNGKILRVRKTDGQGVATNPYYDGNPNSIASRVFAVGLRNPFRFAFHPNPPPGPTAIYLSDNGNSTDRISWLRGGSNGSWSTAGDNGGFLNPPDGNHRVLATDVASVIGAAVASGPPWTDPANPNDPVLYVSNWIQPPSQPGSVKRWRLTGPDQNQAVALDSDQRFATGFAGVDLRFGPDGALYGCTSGINAATGGFYVVQRLRFSGGTPPRAAFSTQPSPATGNAPLTVRFTDASSDPDGQITRRQWDFGDGGSSSDTNPTHTFTTPGTFTVRLTVTDNAGLVANTTATVQVVSSTSLTLAGNIFDGRSGAANTGWPTQVRLRLFYQDNATPIEFAGGVGVSGNGIDVPAGGVVNQSVNVDLTGSLVYVRAQSLTGGAHERTTAFEVPAGATTHRETLRMYLSDVVVRGRVRDTRGLPAVVDIGVARGDASAPFAFSGGRDYAAASGIPATGVAHRLVSDREGYFYFPLPSNAAGATLFFDVVADTGAGQYIPAVFAEPLSVDQVVDRELTLGIATPGGDCDDLSGQPIVPNIDFATQVVPVLMNACSGCHNAGSGNSGGLDLVTDPYGAMVGVPSREVPGRNMVQPGEPGRSYLIEKINCAGPQVGARMRPDGPMLLAQQSLISDWIAQGARRTNGGTDAGFPDSGPRDVASPGADAGGPGAADSGLPAAADPGTGVPGPTVSRRDIDGCSCRSAGTSRGGSSWPFFALVLVLWGRARQARTARALAPARRS